MRDGEYMYEIVEYHQFWRRQLCVGVIVMYIYTKCSTMASIDQANKARLGRYVQLDQAYHGDVAELPIVAGRRLGSPTCSGQSLHCFLVDGTFSTPDRVSSLAKLKTDSTLVLPRWHEGSFFCDRVQDPGAWTSPKVGALRGN